MRVILWSTVLAGATLCGCATGAPAPHRPTPDELAALEARARRDTLDLEAQLRLAGAYRSQGRPRDALAVAGRVLERRPTHARAALLVALTQEDLGRYHEARASYVRAIGASRSSQLRSQLRARLVLLQRRETQAYVKEALAREAELAGTPPRPRTVAVFPLGAPTADTLLGPLGRALTGMLITDLSQTDRLTVLERTVVQLLLDEIRMGERGYVDQATAARGGRLLGAERLVQGSLATDEERLRLEAAVVFLGRPGAAAAGDSTPRAGRRPDQRRPDRPPQQKAAPPPVQRTVPVAEADRLDRLFEMEKRLALRLYGALGIELSPAERAEVTKRRTESLQALLAYGRGLEATDAGDFSSALRFFSQAARLDPGFVPAREQAQTARALVITAGVTTDQLAASADRDFPTPLGTSPLSQQADPLQRDPIVEVLGAEGVLGRTILQFVIRRPGGAQ